MKHFLSGPSLSTDVVHEIMTSASTMIRLHRFLFGIILLASAGALLAACNAGKADNIAPTPAGLPLGKPTFVYLWNFP